MAKLKSLINRHKNFYERNEKEPFDRARRYYRGRFWALSEGASHGTDKLANNLLSSKNIVYAIADTAVSSLLGPNPQVAANPRSEKGEEAAPMVNGLMAWIFDQNKMRRRAALTLIDAVLCKRGIFKTGWSSKDDRPVIKAVDPVALFFDHAARDPDDIRYWLEATVIPWAEYKKRVEAKQYKHHPDVHPDRYPRWMLDESQKMDTRLVRDASRFVTVWEYYNRETGIVQHYIESANAVVFEDEIDYIPYSMYSLNHSGIDCLGISEVQLILNQQQTINDLLTHVKQIIYLMIPRILYDAGRLDEEDLNALVESSVGSFVGINPANAEGMRNMGDMFFKAPVPEPPTAILEFIAAQEADAAFISALADAARGKVTGARTATEMAIIDARDRTRLATREGHLNDAIEDAAAKAFYLCQKYMSKPKMIRIAGERKWAEVGFAELQDIIVDFNMVAYNPIRQNPSVMIEQLIQLLPILTQVPNVDVVRLIEEVVDQLGLPRRILIPEEEARKKEAEAQQQAMQMAQGGAAGEVEAAPPENAPGAEAGVTGPSAVEQGVENGVVSQQALAGMGNAPKVGPG